MARRTWIAACALTVLGGCGNMLDQDRAQPATPARRATTGPTTLATGELDQPQPLPGLTPPPKPFIAIGRHAPPPALAQPSPLLVEHASPDASLAAYGAQPTHLVADFNLGSKLTAADVQRRLGPPAGVAGIEDHWLVYRLTQDRELWLNFADGDGPLVAADVIHGAENGYVRDRVYPVQ